MKNNEEIKEEGDEGTTVQEYGVIALIIFVVSIAVLRMVGVL